MNQTETPFRILLVEDEPADIYLTRKAFEEARFWVELDDVEDGSEALDYLRGEGAHDKPKQPDLILLDLNMPGMDGKSFIRHIKEDDTLCRIPVVVLTTSEAEADVYEPYQLGAAGYVVKPIGIDAFIRAAQKLEDYWFTLVRLPGSP